MKLNPVLLSASAAFVVLLAIAPLHTEAVNQYNCTSCMKFDDIVQIRREQIMELILEKLNLKSVPQITKSPSIAMSFANGLGQTDEFGSALNERKRQNVARQRVTRNGATGPSRFSAASADQVIVLPSDSPREIDFPVNYFSFDANTVRRSVLGGVLRVSLRKPHHDAPEDGQPITVIAYERHGNGTIGHKIAEQQYAYQLDSSNTVVLNVEAHDMKHWFEDLFDAWNPTGVMGIYVEAFYHDHNLAYNTQPASATHHTVSLVLNLEGDVHERKRRQERICRPEDNNPRCCLYELEIDFAEAGWDFIIAPRTYRANMCNGMCEPRQLKANPYTDLASSTRKTNGGTRAVYSPCCHPTEFDDLTVIYITENNTIHKSVITDLIARKCGCS
ncbi:hypothetical protein L596_018474 [Steinernema carpocapsae]|uniref:TGF-beta family profile domain-containing protein n=1 Tax=Steinernema carpocapsae TaxID=34508 RepID=A0A4U5N4Q5_STECR|nr:hypothetical protein L596_018474 [Steinernema carpocapsae]